jgi:hypothetical protein
MYHLRMDIGSRNVLVRMDFISFHSLDQSGVGWWTDWILGIGDVCFFVGPSYLCGVSADDRFNYVIDTYLWSAASALAAMSTSPPLLPIYPTDK